MANFKKPNKISENIYDPRLDYGYQMYELGGYRDMSIPTQHSYIPTQQLQNTQLQLPNQLQGVQQPSQGGSPGAGGAIAAGAGMVANLGTSIIDSGGGPGLDELGVQKVDVGAEAGKGALKGAATGAAAGSVVPVIGTAIGAGVGAVVGGATGFLGGKGKQKKAERQVARVIKQTGEQQAAEHEQNNTQSSYAPTFENGGFIDYTGQDHDGANGGIPIDQQGNPSAISGNPTVALTEDKEVSWLRPDGQSYIFSEKLGFAKDAKKLMNKYKKVLGDDLNGVDDMANEAMNAEFEGLLNKQEEAKSMSQINTINSSRSNELPAFEYGGKQPKEFQYGGFNFDPPQNLGTDPYNEFNTITNNQFDQNISPRVDPGVQPEINDRFIPELSPALNITNALGNAIDYGIAKRNKPNKLNLGRVNAEQINLGRSREDARRRGETSRNISIRNIRDLSRSGSQALSNLGAASTAADRVAGEQISKSFEQEELTNAQLRQRANEQNARLSAQEAQYNTTLENAYQDKLSRLNPLRSVLQQTGQYISDADKNRRFYESAYFQNPNLRGTQDPNVTNWQRFLGNRGTRFNFRD